METVDPQKLQELRKIRENRYYQPNMYFFIDTRHVRIVGIDTGIRGRIDDAQRAWLRRVSEDAAHKPKVLISGKPIFVNGTFNSRLADVNEIVNRFNYRLVIAGDTHNFQKYRIPVTSGGRPRIVWHLVNGGGGAFMNRTHTIPEAREMNFPAALAVRLESEPADFECFPTRDESRRFYGSWFLEKAPDALVDRDQPPYHKSFVKVTVRATGLHVQVFAINDFDAATVAAGPRVQWDILYDDPQ